MIACRWQEGATYRLVLQGENRVGGLVEAVSEDGLAGCIGGLSVGVGQHGAECLCERCGSSVCQAGAGWSWVPPWWRLRKDTSSEDWEEEGCELHLCGVVICVVNECG